MRVLLIDNQPHVREAIEFLLDQQPGIDIVGTDNTSETLPEQAHTLQPDIVLIGWELWRKSATDLLMALRARDVSPKVIVFSSRAEVEQAALTTGADAFLCAYDPLEKFVNVLRTLGDHTKHPDQGSEPDLGRQPAS